MRNISADDRNRTTKKLFQLEQKKKDPNERIIVIANHLKLAIDFLSTWVETIVKTAIRLVFWNYSADISFPDKMNKIWIFKQVFLKLGQD